MNSEKIDNQKEINDKEKKKIFITTKIKKHKNWTKDEDIMLLEIAEKFKQKSWTRVSTFFIDKNPAQCRARYKRIRPGIIKGAWAKEEDEAIIDFVTENGKNWALISKMMPTRNGKQIRDRFLNYLDPKINRDKFTEDEDKQIIESYIEHGSKWSVIAKNFYGRTGDMIKNRFYSCLKRKIHVYEVSNPKRVTKKYYKLKKLKGIRSSQSDHTNKLVKCRFTVSNPQQKQEDPMHLYNYDKLPKPENKFEEQIKTDETRAGSAPFQFINNNNFINSCDNYKLINDIHNTGGNVFSDMANAFQMNQLGMNLNAEKNILNFASALNNLLNEDQTSKLKGMSPMEKENLFYSEILSKNIGNMSALNFLTLSKFLQLKQQLFNDEKSQAPCDNVKNRQIMDFMQSLNGGNTDMMHFMLNYLQARSKGL